MNDDGAAGGPGAGAAPPQQPPTNVGNGRGLSWIAALTRLWCLRGVDPGPRGNPVLSIVGLTASCLALWVVIDRWQRQPNPEFSVDGIPLLAWYGLGVLVLAGLLTWLPRPRPLFGAALILALAVVPVPLLFVGVAGMVLPSPWYEWLGGAVGLYELSVLYRGLRAVTGRSQASATLLGILFLGTFIWTSDVVDAIPDVWTPLEAHAPGSADVTPDRESALFEQAERIDAALEAVRRDASVASQSFFLGFAGVGEQKVFAQEIGLASRVLGERFAMGDRHVSLINDERDLERAPLASVSGLMYALQGLAERMDPLHDVLFLAISSHGSVDTSIAVSNSQFPFTDLTASDLADALRQSGIQWKVIIISACYAGGFVDALRDPKSIVITAAAKDRASFGCANDSDLTYFGEAFYRDALPGSKSLRDAFEAAQKSIAARERSEHETPSNPQAYFGPELERKLAEMSTAK